MDYIPTSKSQQRDMLGVIGLQHMDDMFTDIPETLRFSGELPLPAPMDELALSRHMQELAEKNQLTTLFMGAGSYDHYIPAAVDALSSRQEFYTAYTPYQPEISQGTLTAIFEYQTYICRLTGMDVSNASLYDGAVALTEAVMMAVAHTGKKKVLLPDNLPPQWREVLHTHAQFADVAVVDIACPNGVCTQALQAALDSETAAVVGMTPNYFGIIESFDALFAIAREMGILTIAACNPIALGILPPPEADIIVGDGQPLGNPIGWGGPSLGFIATKDKLLRRLPGRIVGQTVDKNQKRGFVLTMQTREQHIRREKATSNVCTNEALCALRAAMYLALIGGSGLRSVAEVCLQKAHYTCDLLLTTGRFSRCYDAPYFHEFALRYDGDIRRLQKRWAELGITGGLEIEPGVLLFCVTEKRTKAEIDRLVEGVQSC